MRNRLLLIPAVALASLAVVAPAGATIIGVSGAAFATEEGSPSYNANAYDDGAGAKIHWWNEKQNVTLGAALTDVLDITLLGTYDPPPPFVTANGDLAAGTQVSSHFLYFDPRDSQRAVATFSFDADILGIVVLTSNLAATDSLALLASPGAFSARGVEFGPEVIVFGPDRRTLTVDLRASNPGDQIRVITSAVPEPGSMMLLSAGLAALAARRRRRS